MTVYIISSEIKDEAAKTDMLTSLESFGDVWNDIGEVYLVQSRQSSKAIWDNLKTYLSDGDKLFVAKLAADAEWCGFKGVSMHWLNDTLKEGKKNLKKAAKSAH